MIGIDTSIVTIALPDIGSAVGLSTGGLAWVFNAYMIAFGGLLLLGGRAGDIFGRRRVFVGGVALFTVASLLGGFAPNGPLLIAARALQGLAAAFGAPSAMALIAALFTGPARVRALSIFSAVSGGGAALGMILGGVLTEAASWRWVFFVNVPVGVALVLLAPRVLAETPRRPGRFDLPGALTSTVGMAALVYVFIRAGTDGWGDGRVLAAALVAVAALGAFVLCERRAAQPIVPLRMFAHRVRTGAYLTMFLLVGGMFGGYFYLTGFLQDGLGYGPLRTGAAFLPIVGVQFAAVRTVPRVLPRLGARTLIAAGASLLAIAFLWLTALPGDGGYAAWMLGPFLLMGLGVGIATLPLNATVLGTVAQEEAGAASGIAQAMMWSGGAVGAAVMVTVQSGGGGTGGVFALAAAFEVAALVAAAVTIGRR
ncbi:putative MFS-type transporter EfpA [Actinomadura rubteroloni]|uniref:Putative MFS-type transporter EfpA n=2 Tax=Actinomadura rubteroloni TaxID=1926885 RepID=A0A2P4UEA2_9ACTN|nr:putative MFS-type transporter EfpA [Actinomadura rubteroloni]